MLKINDVVKAAAGKLLQGNKDLVVREVSTDSRKIIKGSLFIAIGGERFDGHDFITDAIKKGARAIVVSRDVKCSEKIAVIRVKDTTRALGHIARFYRDQFQIPVIAITGSVGKTTTKEMLACVLEKKMKVLKNIKTENNHFGVPQTLLKLKKSHKIVVLELGTNQFGDISWLTYIANPTVAILTSVGESHLEGLKTAQGVFKEKFNLVRRMCPQGTVIFNGDNRYLGKIRKIKIPQRKIMYAIKGKAHNRATQIERKDGHHIEFKARGKEFSLKTPAIHNVYNALAVISCGYLQGVAYADIKDALAHFSFDNGRSEVRKIHGVWIINDSYNANPVSFRSAIQTLDAFQARGKKILICADMLELGNHSMRLHEEIGKAIAKTHIDYVMAIGEFSKYIVRQLKNKNRIHAFHYSNIENIYKGLKTICTPEDVVLIKGSRGMHMERIVEFFNKHLN